MTSNYRTTDQIERDIEHERAELSGSITDLQQKFSVEGIVRDVGDMFRGKDGELGGELGRMITEVIGRNQAATALTAVGLAWMFLGPRSDTRQRDGTARRSDSRYNAARGGRDAWESENPWDSRLARTSGNAEGPRHNYEPHWYGDDRQAARDHVNGRFGRSDGRTAQSSDLSNGGVSGALRSGAEAIGDSVSDMAGDVRESVLELKDRLAHGTEGFSQEARDRVVAARQAAHDGRLAAEAAVNRGGRAAAGAFEDQPLIVGALALALGAAIGGALPRSNLENEALGDSSDRLFHEAQSVFREERDKAKAVLSAAADEAKRVYTDTHSEIADMAPDANSARDVVMNRMSEAGTRVADEAWNEAERQGLASRKD